MKETPKINKLIVKWIKVESLRKKYGKSLHRNGKPRLKREGKKKKKDCRAESNICSMKIQCNGMKIETNKQTAMQ